MLCFTLGAGLLFPRERNLRNTSRVVAPPRRTSPGARRACIPRAEANFYDILGVPRDANQMTIKKAYRRAALRSHPDVSKAPDAKERFMRIQSAYAVLSDETKRRAYDRKSSSGFGSFEDFASAAGASGSGFNDLSDYAKRWREKNPMPEDLNDSLGNIFGDLFSGVSKAAGKTASGRQSIFDDFVEFLEDQAGGFASGTGSGSSYGKVEDKELSEILATGSVEVLEAELDDTMFLLSQLQAREAKLRSDYESLRTRAKDWELRASRSSIELDIRARDEARTREAELKAEAERVRERQKKVRQLISSQEKRRTKLEDALKQRRTAASSGSGVRTRSQSQEDRRREVDDELEKMKREMGL